MPDVVYAVHVANYEPPEVIALYSNRTAAREHVERSLEQMLQISPWTVERTYTAGDNTSSCHNCGHTLVRLNNQWTCTKQCRCTMAGCCPRRSS